MTPPGCAAAAAAVAASLSQGPGCPPPHLSDWSSTSSSNMRWPTTLFWFRSSTLDRCHCTPQTWCCAVLFQGFCQHSPQRQNKDIGNCNSLTTLLDPPPPPPRASLPSLTAPPGWGLGEPRSLFIERVASNERLWALTQFTAAGGVYNIEVNCFMMRCVDLLPPFHKLPKLQLQSNSSPKRLDNHHKTM